MDTEALRKSLLSKFRDVTADRLEKIGLALLALEKDSSASGPADDVARELHTMKGEARMLGLPRIGELAHAAEDVLKAAREGRTTFSAATDLLLQMGDLVGTLLEDLSSAEKPNSPVAALVATLGQAAAAAADASRKATEQGERLGTVASGSVEGILSGVQETSDAARVINLATQQQRTATEQVVSSMGEIEEVTRQTTQASKQATGASSELTQLAARLAELIKRFQIE